MKLCIDNRERLRIPSFEGYIKSGKCAYIDGIETGNYATSDIHTPDGLIGIEYKKDDLMESIYSGLLDKQLKELKDNFQYPYLFIGYEGINDTIMNNIGSNPEVITGKLASILARQKVTIMFTGDLLVPFTLKVIERFYDGQTPIKNIQYTPIRRRATSKEVRHAMMEQIPRFGAKKVNALLDNYDVILVDKQTRKEPSIEDLMKIKGMGKKLAGQIKDVLK